MLTLAASFCLTPSDHSLNHVWRFCFWLAQVLFVKGTATDLVIARHLLFHLPFSFFCIEWAAVGAAFVTSIVWTIRSPRGSPLGRSIAAIARRRKLAVLVVFLGTLAGRLAMLNTNPLPKPHIADEFGYLLAADTYEHFRLTNPTPPAWHHFETIHQLMVPTYMTKYPPAPGMWLALGQLLFHSAAIAVLLSCAAMAAAVCWQLQAMMPPVWAFLGGLLAAARLGTISYWADSYWGGALTALACCVLLGAIARWARKPSISMALIAATASLVAINCRPFESGLLVLGVLASLAWQGRHSLRRTFPIQVVAAFVVVIAIGAAAMALDNLAVTGKAGLLPYVLQTQQYGVTPALVVQKAPQPARAYRYNGAAVIYTRFERLPYDDEHTLSGYVVNLLGDKLGSYGRFYLGPSLVLLLLGVPAALTRRKDLPFTLLILLVVLVVALETWTQPHYLASFVGVFYFLFLLSARYMRTWGRSRRIGVILVRTVGLACLFSLLLRVVLLPRGESAAWDGIAARDWGRPHVLDRLNLEPGNHLVMVAYNFKNEPNYDEWVFNSADLASQKVIWAHTLAPEEGDAGLECTFAGRQPWLVNVWYVGESHLERYSLQKLPPPVCGEASGR